ncbi:MAG: isoprenylcysteine carboxylmethyltransferase family protein [Pseudomonadota bacterium]
MFARALNTIHKVFNNEELRSILTKLRYPIVLIFFILLITQIKPALFWPGFLVTLFGELIQAWSFASLEKNRTLSIKGPYMFTRNPMYIGRFFLLLGCMLLMGNIWAILVFCVLYYFYMVNRVKREEKRLLGLFGEAYKNYCQKVNRFVPSFRISDRRSWLFFKGSLFFQNNGHWNLLAVLSCYVVFYLFTF